MRPAPTIALDLDGTLIDTAHDLVATLNVVLGEAGCDPLPLAEARNMIGHGARALLLKGLAARGRPTAGAAVDALHRRFLDHYTANVAVLSRPFDGMEAALEVAAAAGWRLAILTNKPEGLARLLLRELRLDRHFAAIVGGDTYPYGKPDLRVFRDCVAAAGGDPSHALMVGDSRTDLDTARNAQVPCILVDFGYTDVPAADLGADRVISHWRDFMPAALALLATARAA